jgi:hypothetical protein
MRRALLIIAVLLVAAVVGIWLLPSPPPPAPPPPPPAAERRGPPLQADAEGTYVPGYRFAVGRFRFSGFSLRPEPLVFFGTTVAGCEDSQVLASAFRISCEHPQVGTVTIDGRFLVRAATQRLDAQVASALVTVRNVRGEVQYRARDSFTWEPDR